jgi:mRNA interferase RelE/StbE
MTYTIQIQDRAVKSLKKIPEPYKTHIKNTIDHLVQFSPAMSNIKALQGEYRGLFRMRSGDYRILFDVVNATIIIVDIFHRQTGY